MSEYDDLRGVRVRLGKFVFEVPEAMPENDAAVMVIEDLLAKMHRATAPARITVKRWKMLRRGMREDIEESMIARQKEEAEPMLPFILEAPRAKPPGETAAKVSEELARRRAESSAEDVPTDAAATAATPAAGDVIDSDLKPAAAPRPRRAKAVKP